MQVPAVIRESLIKNICSAIHKQHYVVCICPERSGLSTLLKQLGNYLISEGTETRYSVIDLARLDLVARERFCVSFRYHLCDSEPSLTEYLPADESTFACLAALAIAAPFSTVIALDNFHKLPISSQREFLATSRRFHTERHTEPLYQRVLLVIGGAIDLHACEPEETSPFNIADRIYPPDFDLSRDEVRNYLAQRLSVAGVYVDEIAQNYVYDLTRGQIHFLEMLCDQLVRQVQRVKLGEVSMDEIDSTVATLFHDKDAYLTSLLEKIDSLESDTKVLLSEVLGGKRHKFSRLNVCIRQLELLGVLREEHHFATIHNPLLELCIRESNLTFSPAVAPTTLIMPRVIGGNARAYEILFELENDIRNFIMSGLYGKYKSKWISYIPESNGWNQTKGRHNKHRKDAWKGQVSYPLVGFSFFSDLKEAIEANWNIFSAYFQPQDKFFSYLDRLEEIRNEVAHNRLLSHRNLRELESIRAAFMSCMTAK